jgi:hypothetical protein
VDFGERRESLPVIAQRALTAKRFPRRPPLKSDAHFAHRGPLADETVEAVDLGQTPADVVFLSSPTRPNAPASAYDAQPHPAA